MIGTKLSDRYEIIGELGRGGMGVVYRARDPLLNRDVAVKLLPTSLFTPEGEERFQREAQLVAQMDHPSIVAIHDVGRHAGALFFVMPVVGGTSLRAYIREGSLRLGDVVEIGIQAAEALEYSHGRDVVHRDVKPENIMVSREEGPGLRVRIMDFGLARRSAENRLTRTGALVGTTAYLSPEQVDSSAVDGRSDVYSLGAVLFECLVGDPPFVGEVQQVLYRIVHETPRSPRSLGAEIDEPLEQLVLKCLEKDRSKRPQRASELAALLRGYLSNLRESDRLRPIEASTRIGLRAPRPTGSPFVGRQRESAELHKRLFAALDGECQFVVVGGEPGAGKSRLVEELDTLARVRKVRVLHGRFLEQDQALPYEGFREVIQDFFVSREKAGFSGETVDLSDLAAELVSLFPVLSEIRDVRSAAAGAQAAGGEAHRAEDRTHIFELLARTLTRLAAGNPLLLLFENLHNADVSIEALQYVFRRLGPTPTLLVGTYRQTEIDRQHPLARMLDRFSDDPRFLSLVLGPLSASEHRTLLASLAGGAELAPGVAEKLYEASEGNPFFITELVRSLKDSGGITTDEAGRLSLAGGAASEALPATIQQAVEKRVQRLPERLRDVLSLASVMGKSFEFRDLEVLAEGRTGLEEAIDRLLAEGLIEEERESRGDWLAFSSGVVRDVLYAAVPRRKRRSLHRRYAELLEARHAERLDRVAAQLLHHYAQGDVPEKVAEHGLPAVRRSLEAFSPEDAARAARTVLDFVADESWTGERAVEAEARLLLAEALRQAGDLEGTLHEAEKAIRIFERGGQRSRAVAATLRAAEAAWGGGRIEAAERWVEQGIEAARAGREHGSLARLLSLGATVANLRGEYARANQYLEEAERISPAMKDASSEEEVPRGGRLVVALANPVLSLEPATINTDEELEILSNVFETLLTNDAEGRLIPGLAESWEALDGGRSFLLQLRADLRFEDGKLLDAADVKASFERSIRLAGTKLPAAFGVIRGVADYQEGTAEGVAGLVASSAHAIRIDLVEPLPICGALLTDLYTAVAREAKDAAGEARVLGTGPFRIASRDPERVVLERNLAYARGAGPRLDAIEFRTSLSAAAIGDGFRAGDLDLVRDLLPEDLERLLRDPGLRGGLVETLKKNTYFVLFNTSRPAGANLALRRALSGVLRPHDLVWRTLGRFAQPAAGIIPPGILGHDAGRKRSDLSRDKALELLRSAELPQPIHLTAAVHPLFQDRYGALLRALLAAWSDLGVEVSVATPSMESFLDSWERNQGTDVFIGRYNADYDDPDNFTYTLFHSKRGLLRNYFSSPDADRLIEQGRAESRPAVREASYRKIEELLLEGHVLVPLFHDVDYRLARPNVRGLRLRSVPPFVNYSEIGKAEAPAPAPSRARGSSVLQLAIADEMTSLDPALAVTAYAIEVAGIVFETLTRQAGEARTVPWLAAEFRAEEGGRRFRFRLRDDVRFHDGRRLTARDVRYSLERFLRKGVEFLRSSLWPIRGARALVTAQATDLAGFQIVSPLEFTIDLEEPVSFFPVLLSNVTLGIVPEGSEGFHGAWRDGRVGTGPFRVVQFEAGRRLELERHPDYWRKGLPQSDGLVFRFGLRPEELLAEFRAGRLSLVCDLLPTDVEELRRDAELAGGYQEIPGLTTYFLAFNTRREALGDPALRRRLARSVDVPALVRRTVGRLAIPAHGVIPPGLLGHEPVRVDSGGPTPRPAPAADKRPAELKLTAAIHPAFLNEYAGLFRELEGLLAHQGIRLVPHNRTMAEYNEAHRAGGVDLVAGRWVADYPDSDSFAHSLFESEQGFLGRICGSAELDALVARARAELDPLARHGLYRQFEEALARDAVLLPLFHEQVYRFARPEVEGLHIGFSQPVVNYEGLRIRR